MKGVASSIAEPQVDLFESLALRQLAGTGESGRRSGTLRPRLPYPFDLVGVTAAEDEIATVAAADTSPAAPDVPAAPTASAPAPADPGGDTGLAGDPLPRTRDPLNPPIRPEGPSPAVPGGAPKQDEALRRTVRASASEGRRAALDPEPARRPEGEGLRASRDVAPAAPSATTRAAPVTVGAGSERSVPLGSGAVVRPRPARVVQGRPPTVVAARPVEPTPVVEIHIGRIDVRAPVTAGPAPPVPPPPRDDRLAVYLARRNRGGRS